MILEDIDLQLKRGQAIGVIGESGSGKTTLARAVAGLLAPCAGTMQFDGRELKPTLAQRSRDELRRIQIVFQLADTALNPSQTIERILARPLRVLQGPEGRAAAAPHRRTARPGAAAARAGRSACRAGSRAGRSSA